jgi:hypothetical protein
MNLIKELWYLLRVRKKFRLLPIMLTLGPPMLRNTRKSRRSPTHCSN